MTFWLNVTRSVTLLVFSCFYNEDRNWTWHYPKCEHNNLNEKALVCKFPEQGSTIFISNLDSPYSVILKSLMGQLPYKWPAIKVHRCK